MALARFFEALYTPNCGAHKREDLGVLGMDDAAAGVEDSIVAVDAAGMVVVVADTGREEVVGIADSVVHYNRLGRPEYI